MNEQTQPEKVPLGELYGKSEANQEELDKRHTLKAEVHGKPKLSKLEKLERQKSQIETKIKAIEKRENEKTRRERTRRLIQIGSLSEKYFNCPDIPPSDYEGLLKKLLEPPEVKTILKKG